jgi:hypothetical protein
MRPVALNPLQHDSDDISANSMTRSRLAFAPAPIRTTSGPGPRLQHWRQLLFACSPCWQLPTSRSQANAQYLEDRVQHGLGRLLSNVTRLVIALAASLFDPAQPGAPVTGRRVSLQMVTSNRRDMRYPPD